MFVGFLKTNGHCIWAQTKAALGWRLGSWEIPLCENSVGYLCGRRRIVNIRLFPLSFPVK